ncbi:MAG: hypothetical protein Q9174_005507, partial [Haloplaca sp. 1 TL-2023]
TSIRWDIDEETAHHKVSFPCSDKGVQGFEALVRVCEPATFGLDNRDVLDEGYRKAGKLDNTAFSTNFHPHDFGIVDVVQQILMPTSMGEARESSKIPHRVRAELYKLNVYSGPSGKFLSHVDTPRGVNQFGSLVVCLPSAHEGQSDLLLRSSAPGVECLSLMNVRPPGGTLRVKHSGQIIDFDWASPSPQIIQWAAFYGDCEHEVLEVTSGHRVTLTYSLYSTTIGNLASPISDPTKLPLYDAVAPMLRNPSFMRKGGHLGFFCHHAYAHSTEAGRRQIPGAFKGLDLAIFSAFRRLGLKVKAHPILHKKKSWDYGTDYDNEWGGMSAKELICEPISDDLEDKWHSNESDYVERWMENAYRSGDFRVIASERTREMFGRYEDDGIGDGTISDYEEEEEKDRIRDNLTIVGAKMHGPAFNDWQDEELDERASHAGVINEWRHVKLPSIVWMNEPRHEDFACAGLAYGNQACLDYKFSAAAILVTIPSSKARGLKVETPAKLDKSKPAVQMSKLVHFSVDPSDVIDLTDEISSPPSYLRLHFHFDTLHSLIQGIRPRTLIIYKLLITIYRLIFHPLSNFPGPKLAAATRLYEAYYDILQGGKYIFHIGELHKKYGPIVRISPHELHINDPIYHASLYSHTGRWDKYDFTYRGFGIPKSSFCTLDHDVHQKRRAPLVPLFSKESVSQREPFLREQVERLKGRVERNAASGDVLEIGLALAAFTMDITTGYGLGYSMRNLDRVDFNRDLANFFTDFGPLWVLGKHLPFLPWLFRRAPRWMLSYLGNRLAAYKAFIESNSAQVRTVMSGREKTTRETKDHTTITHKLLEADDIPPTSSREKDLCEEGDVVVSGGTEASRALRVITYHVCANPKILKRLREELDRAAP